ncbi:BnaA05g18370D [Brassica napus]|uniref:BnaA05g18370D protein n=3 Tax=Brassica TaxID=3705 RepID=A0A078GTE9_BRANA|nr:BnaA05g18380D [Brassica napus]CDY28403.1 BnaA05g18370D [Brassica napus]
MQRWSNQKLTWKRKDLLSKFNLVDATLWMQNLSMETRGCNYEDVEPVNKPE